MEREGGRDVIISILTSADMTGSQEGREGEERKKWNTKEEGKGKSQLCRNEFCQTAADVKKCLSCR